MQARKKLSLFFCFILYMVATFSFFGNKLPHFFTTEDKEIFFSFCNSFSTEKFLEQKEIFHSCFSDRPPSAQKNEVWSVENVDTSRINRSRRLIAFTFDDAPSNRLEELVAVFLNYNATHPDAPASATLFCNGCRIHRPIDTALHAAVTAGFELGNHSQNHKKLTTLSWEELRKELDTTDERLSHYDGQSRHLFRAPYGEVNADVCSAVNAPVIDWFIDTLDWTGIPAEEIYDRVWKSKGSGVIVLMHDGYENTLTALKRLLPDLYEAGYQAVTVSQMAKAHACNLRCGAVYTRARKNTHR